jgi:hypothetical protein
MTDAEVKALVERLTRAKSVIGKLASEHRGPRMSIPANEAEDEDLIIAYALRDAKSTLRRQQAIVEAAREVKSKWRNGELTTDSIMKLIAALDAAASKEQPNG